MNIMKKIQQIICITIILFACFLLCNKLIVIAMENDTQNEDIKITGTNSEGIIELDFDENSEIILETTNDDYQIYDCDSWGGIVKTEFNTDINKCIVTAKQYGVDVLYLDIKTPTNNTRINVEVNIELEEYIEGIKNSIPNEFTGSIWNLTEIEDYLDKKLPTDIDGKIEKCNNVDNKLSCEISLKYTYLTQFEEWEEYIVNKTVTLKSFPLPELNTYNLKVGRSTQIYYELNENLSEEDIIFVSLDNGIASVSKSGEIIGKSAGTTEIRLYNKNTFEYTSGTVIVSQIKYKDAESLLDDVNNKVITIDANTLPRNIDYKHIAEIYFNNLLDSLENNGFIIDNGIDCEGNKCRVTFNYNYNRYTTDEFTLNIVGLQAPDIVYTSVGETFTIDNYITSYNGEKVNLIVDENYIKWNEEKKHFEILKVGDVKVSFLTDYEGENYIKETTFKITHKHEDIESIQNQLNEIDGITLPYNRIDFNNNLNELASIVKSNLEKEITNDNLNDYININVACFLPDKCSASIYLQFGDLSTFQLESKAIKVIYSGLDNENSELIQKINIINSLLEDNYILSFEDTVLLENKYLDDKDFYSNLIEKTNVIEILEANELDYSITEINNKKISNDLKGSTEYKITFKNEDIILYERNITVNSNHILTLEGVDDSTEQEKLDIIKNKIEEILTNNIKVSKLYSNIYQIEIESKKFNVLFDQQELIELNSIDLDENGKELKINETYKINYETDPENANYGNVTYKSSNESVATVDSNGLVTAKSKGYTIITVNTDNSFDTMIIVVDMTIEDLLNKSIEKIPTNYTINYNSLNDYTTEYDIIYEKIAEFVDENNIIGGYSPYLYQEGDKYYIEYEFEVSDELGYVYSNRKEITYELKGIKVNSNNVSLNVNETYDLEVKFSEGSKDNLYYEIEDDSIISVTKDGKIKALKPGKTYLNIYDKYNRYSNQVLVSANIDDFLDSKLNELQRKPIVINGDEKINYYYFEDEKSIITEMFVDKIKKSFDIEEYFDGYNTLCDLENLKCSLILRNYTNEIIERNVEFEIKLEGIFVESNSLSLTSNIEEELKYNVYPSDSLVNIESLNTDICEISENNKVITKETGVCKLKYTTNNHTAYQIIIVNEDEIINNTITNFNNVTSTINIKNSYYNVNVSIFENDYLNYRVYYENLLNKHIAREFNTPYIYNLNFYLLNEKNELDVNLELYYEFVDKEEGINYYYLFDGNITKTFKFTYEDIPSEYKEIETNFINSLNNVYNLSLNSLLRFQTSNDTIEDLHNYTNLRTNIESICKDCTYEISDYLNRLYGDFLSLIKDKEKGINLVNSVIIYKGDYPIANIPILISKNFDIRVGEQSSFDDVINIIENKVKEEYIELKNSELSQATLPMLKGNTIFAPTLANSDVIVSVKKLTTITDGPSTYLIEVDGYKFEAEINIIAPDTNDYIKEVPIEKIIFNSNDGNADKIEQKVTTSSFLKTNSFTRKGYIFTGWNTEADGTGKTYKNKELVSNIDLTQDSSLNLYAEWEPITYTIKYYGNGSTSGSTSSQTKLKYDTYFNLNKNRFIKNGYMFAGWNTKSDGTGTTYTNEQKLRNLTSTNGKTIKLYAQWRKREYKITYDLNGGTQNKKNATSFYITSKTFNLYEPTKTGYTFGGWYLNGTKTKITKVTSGTTKNIDIFASWTANRYNITYNGNGATSGTTTKQTKLKYGNKYNLSSNRFKKKGYTFVEWNTEADGTGKSFKNKQSIKNLTSTNGKTFKLYAIWKKTKYKVNYDLNGGTQNKKNATSFYITSKTFSLYEPTKKGYTFGGWYLNGTKTKITKVTSGTTKNIDIFASWTANRYNITYYGNGATSGTTTKQTKLKYGNKYNLSSNGFKKKGYTFVEWNTEADGTGKSFKNKQSIKNLTSTNGKTFKLYAIWKKNK